LWAQACAPQSLFEDEGGELGALSSISRAKYAKGWGRWLSFLAEHDPHALQLPPADRCSKARVQAYVDQLRRSGNSEGTIVNRLQELAVVTRVMASGFDPRLINRYISAVRSKARPVRSKSHVRPANELLDLGLRLMATAIDAGDLDHAVAFRDGLIVGFLAMHPVRRRNLADFKIGRNLIRQGNGFIVTFAGSETKTGAVFENRLAELLVEPMNQYLRQWRPILAKRTGRWKRDLDDAVWVSVDGSPMSQEGLSGRIELRTLEAFGKAISPHRFRDAAATTLVIEDPARAHVAARLLGHRSLATTEKHYIQASGLEAQRSFLEVMIEARRG
jgi:integrase